MVKQDDRDISPAFLSLETKRLGDHLRMRLLRFLLPYYTTTTKNEDAFFIISIVGSLENSSGGAVVVCLAIHTNKNK